MSVRQRAVDLLYAMCDRSNAEEIVGEMLEYLESADYSIREEMVGGGSALISQCTLHLVVVHQLKLKRNRVTQIEATFFFLITLGTALYCFRASIYVDHLREAKSLLLDLCPIFSLKEYFLKSQLWKQWTNLKKKSRFYFNFSVFCS